LIQHWRQRRAQQFAAAAGSASGSSLEIGIGEALRVVVQAPQAELIATGHAPTVIVTFPEILVGATLVGTGSKTDDGDIVVAITPVFRRF
jgi:hypothetical protein